MLKKYTIRKGSLAWWISKLLPWLGLALFLVILGLIGHEELSIYCQRHYLPLP